MKILFFSDIHGIHDNLEYIRLLEEKEKFDKIVVLGDLYYGGPNYDGDKLIKSNMVKNFLTNYQDKLICLKGNCDSDVDIKASDFPICNNLALIHVDGIDIYCTHGNEYNIENDRKFKRKGVLIYGHEHYPYIEKKDDMIFINVGSISLPRNNSTPSYCIYSNKEFIIYDINGIIQLEV
jgi:uncharacterized protein